MAFFFKEILFLKEKFKFKNLKMIFFFAIFQSQELEKNLRKKFKISIRGSSR